MFMCFNTYTVQCILMIHSEDARGNVGSEFNYLLFSAGKMFYVPDLTSCYKYLLQIPFLTYMLTSLVYCITTH